jgi:hypothetical protein
MPNPTRVPITQPRVPFLNPETGFVSTPWYLFLLSLSQLTGGSEVSLGDLQKGPPTLTVDEINAIIDKAAGDITPSQDGLLAQIAELQKQVNALALQVHPELGTLSAVNIDWVPYLGFDTAPPWIGTTAGQFWFDSATGAFNAKMGNNNITQQVGEEFFRYGKASAPISDVNLQAVYKTGTVGASGVITFAPTIAGITEADQILGIATEPIATNGFGRITTSGVVRGIDTTGSVYGEVWADNDDIWYNPVTGGLTKVKPVAPNIKLQMGTVINAGAGSGSFFVNIGSTSALGGTDSNVQLGTLATSDLLQYNGTYWTNVTPSAVIAGAGGAPVTKTANFTVAAGETWLINNKSGSSCTVTLPTPSASTGRVLHFQNYQAQTLVSASSNVVPLVGGAATTAILQAVAGANATLVSDGTSWIMTQYDSNNSLELE